MCINLAIKLKIREIIKILYQQVNKLMFAEENHGVKEIIEINTL